MKRADSRTPYLLVNGTGHRESIGAYCDRGGYRALHNIVHHSTPEKVIAMIREAGLRGKGGANFPADKKLEMVRAAAGAGTRYLVCNGGEHEPGSRKDGVLMELYPHAIIEGALIAAYAVGASVAYMYITEDQSAAIDSMRRALQEAREHGCLALGTGDKRFACEFVCILGPATYVAGEETAVINAIESKEAKPRSKPPYPSVEGLFGCPTLINNVETLATVSAIIDRGVQWYRSYGMNGCTGGMLVTLGAEVNRPGVYEIPYGTTLLSLINDYGGGTVGGKAIKALLPGGPSLPFIKGNELDLPITHEALQAAGSGVGCGAVRIWLEDSCMVEASLEIAEFFAREQCGQCPMCRMETNAFALMLRQLKTGQSNENAFAQIRKTAAFTHGKGKCSLINMAAAPILSALDLFEEDFRYHIEHGRCFHAESPL